MKLIHKAVCAGASQTGSDKRFGMEINMEFIKKQALGFYLTLASAILAVVGVIFYLINCNTAYFTNKGVNATIIACLIIAVVLQLVFIVANQLVGAKPFLDIFPIIAAVLITVAAITFVGARVDDMATIMTFEYNAQTMGDLSSALVGIVCCVIAMIIGIASSFCRVVKES